MPTTEPSVLTIPVDVGGIWHYGWAVGLILFLFFSIFSFRDRIPVGVKICLAYFVARALWILEAPKLPFGDYTRAFQATAGQTVAEIILLSVAVLAFKKHFRSIAIGVALIEIAGIWFLRAGLLGWESFDSALLALCIPFVGLDWLVVTSVITILAHHGSTALLILFVYTLVERWQAAVLALPVLGTIAYIHANGRWLDGMERLQTWFRFMKFWSTDYWNVAFGTGGGTFMWISCLLDKFKPPIFLQLHNDWLQILFEDGVVGLGLALCVFYWSYERSKYLTRFSKRIRAGILGAGVFALTYHPMRFMPSAFIIGLIFATAITAETGSKK